MAAEGKPKFSAKEYVDSTIKEGRVVMISKSYCPYCKKAYHILTKYRKDIIKKEIDTDFNQSDRTAIQQYCKEITGGSSVPRVFIDGKFIGGCDDIEKLDKQNKLRPLIEAEFQIFVRIRMKKKNMVISVSPHTVVQELKCKIQDQENISPELQQLFIAHMGKYMQDDITMRDYNIQKHAQLELRLRSKPGPPQTTIPSKYGTGSIPIFPSHMSLEDASELKVHDKIDHRDEIGRFLYATVSQKQGSNLMIHYDGWSKKWDTWSDFKKEIHQFAKAGSISKRPAHRLKHLKKGDYIDINPTHRHPASGWTCGEIKRFDKESGQIQVIYTYGDKHYLYWAHLDDENEIAKFGSRHECPSESHAVEQRQVSRDQDMSNKQNQLDGQTYYKFMNINWHTFNCNNPRQC